MHPLHKYNRKSINTLKSQIQFIGVGTLVFCAQIYKLKLCKHCSVKMGEIIITCFTAEGDGGQTWLNKIPVL